MKNYKIVEIAAGCFIGLVVAPILLGVTTKAMIDIGSGISKKIYDLKKKKSLKED